MFKDSCVLTTALTSAREMRFMTLLQVPVLGQAVAHCCRHAFHAVGTEFAAP